MTSNVVQLHPPRRFIPAAYPARPPRPVAGECYLVAGEDGGWVVVDVSSSGDSAGWHGWYADRAEALTEGRRIAAELGRRFLDDNGDEA